MSGGGGSRYNDSKNKTQTAKTAEIDPKKKKEEALNFLNCKHSVQNLEHKNCKKPRLPWRPSGTGEKKFVSKTDPKANRCHLATRARRWENKQKWTDPGSAASADAAVVVLSVVIVVVFIVGLLGFFRIFKFRPRMASAYSLAPPVLFPHWNYLPTPVLEQVAACFTSLRDVLQTMLVCKKWYYALSDDRSEIWAIFAGRRLSKAVLKSPVLYSLPSYKAKLRALSYAWDAAECSRNIFIKPNGFTLHRNPVAQSTDAARGKLGLTAGRHCWEVCWEGPLGTVAVVGVATKEATLQAAGYVPLIGSNVHSWGWNLVENSLVHGGHCTGAYPRLANAPRYQTGDRLRIILDCDSQTLAFERDYEFLGIAFFSLPKKPLYPAVSAVYGNTEISMVYLGWPLDG